jgi:hypothetical protein
MVLMFLWDAPLDVPGAPRDAEPREAAASAAPRVSVVEFAPVDGAAQLARLREAGAAGEAAVQLREAGALGEAAVQLREAGALGEAAAQVREELREVDEPAGLRARARPPERVRARELARIREVDSHALVGSRCCDSGQVLAWDAARSGAAADSHALR